MAVYIIGNRDKNLYKVGVSKHPEKRLLEIQTGNPYKLEIIYTYKTQNDNKVEEDYHNLFNEYRLEGEWFKLTDKELEETHMFITRISKKKYKTEKFIKCFNYNRTIKMCHITKATLGLRIYWTIKDYNKYVFNKYKKEPNAESIKESDNLIDASVYVREMEDVPDYNIFFDMNITPSLYKAEPIKQEYIQYYCVIGTNEVKMREATKYLYYWYKPPIFKHQETPEF